MGQKWEFEGEYLTITKVPGEPGCSIWWKKGNKYFGVRNMRKFWKRSGMRPALMIHTNGAKRSHGDVCYDWTLVVGYHVFNYTNFDLQRVRR